jgi:hypothetical protein
VSFHDPVRDREAQARPFVLGTTAAPVPIEHPRHILGRNPRAIVGNPKEQIRTADISAYGDLGRAGLACVSYKIGENLSEAIAVERDMRQI